MIILTGGAGFIGSCFLKFLNDKGITDIIVVDNLASTNKWKNLVGKKFYKYINKNNFFNEISDLQDLNLTAIFHFGACSSTTEKNFDYLYENNFDFSVRLAKLSLINQVPFIYASSAATYGNGDNGYDDNVFEPLRPLNGYGYSKHLFDLWVLENGYDKIFTGLKFFNVYGPNEYHKNDMASMIFKSFNQMQNIGKIRLFESNTPLYKNGDQLRDFIYVKDVISITWELYEKQIKGIFNLGTGQARSWNDLANAVFSALNTKPSIEYFPMPEHLKEQYQNFTQANMQKMKNYGINFNFTSLEDGVKDYVQNFLTKNNPYF